MLLQRGHVYSVLVSTVLVLISQQNRGRAEQLFSYDFYCDDDSRFVRNNKLKLAYMRRGLIKDKHSLLVWYWLLKNSSSNSVSLNVCKTILILWQFLQQFLSCVWSSWSSSIFFGCSGVESNCVRSLLQSISGSIFSSSPSFGPCSPYDVTANWSSWSSCIFFSFFFFFLTRSCTSTCRVVFYPLAEYCNAVKE